jgi:hypothetical protein
MEVEEISGCVVGCGKIGIEGRNKADQRGEREIFVGERACAKEKFILGFEDLEQEYSYLQ